LPSQRVPPAKLPDHADFAFLLKEGSFLTALLPERDLPETKG